MKALVSIGYTYDVDTNSKVGDWVRIPATDYYPSRAVQIVSFDTDYEGYLTYAPPAPRSLIPQ